MVFTRQPILCSKDSWPDDTFSLSLCFFSFLNSGSRVHCALECIVRTNPISRGKAWSEPVVQQHRAVECSLGETARLHALIMRLLAWTHCFPPVAREGIAELNKNK